MTLSEPRESGSAGRPRENGTPSPSRVVLVVHGVGSQQAGETVDTFASTVAAKSGHTVRDEKLPLRDAPRPGRQVDTFPAHLRRLGNSRGEVLVAEVYWGDADRLPRNALGIASRMFKLIFHLRHVIDRMADQKAWLVQRFRDLARLVAWMVRGPVAAINAYMFAVATCCAFLLKATGAKRAASPPELLAAQDAADQWADTANLLLGVTILLPSLWAARHFYKKGFSWPIFAWLGVGGVAFAAIAASSLAGEQPRTFNDYATYLIGTLDTTWTALQTLVVLMFYVGLAAWWSLTAEKRRGLSGAYIATMLMAGLWGIAITAFWVAANKLTPRHVQVPGLPTLAEDGFLHVVPLWFAGGILLISTVLTWSRRRWQARRGPPTQRLLGGPFIMGGAVLAALFWTCFLLVRALGDPWGWLDYLYLEEFALWTTNNVQGHVIPLVLCLAGLVGWLVVAVVASGLDIGLDVVDYFRREPDPVSTRRKPRRVRARRMGFRFRQVLSALEQRGGSSPKLTIIAHSQGSILAIDELARRKEEPRFPRFEEICLVTMGSPFFHVYQHYFPRDYPPLDDAKRWKGMQRTRRFRKWLNIYREDDFVGRASPNPDTSWPRDIAVGTGGHADYWSDEQVLDTLQSEGVL